MERYHLWSLFIQLLYFLYPVDSRVKHIDLAILEAAEDPALEMEYFAKLLHYADCLIGR